METAEIQEQETIELEINIPKPNSTWQDEFVRCGAKRQMAKVGRRGGKTFGFAIKAMCRFLGRCNQCLGEGCSACDYTGRVDQFPVLYGTPVSAQIDKFWYEITTALAPGIDAGYFKKNETEHYIEIPHTEIRIQARTAWNASSLRGGWWGLIGLDEFQLMNEDTWESAAQPMLADVNGTAVFMFTPPSLKDEGVIKAKDPRHASKLFKKALEDTSGIWKTFHATSHDNPDLSKKAIEMISKDMSSDTYRREIMGIDDEIEASWLVYSKFDEAQCKIKRFEIPESWPVFAGHDFGQANPAALFLAQVREPLPPAAPTYLRHGDYVAFAEYAPGAGYSAEQHAERYREILGNSKLEKAVGGNVTTEEEIRQLYRRLGWYIYAPEITKVNAQVERAIALMEHRQFYIFEDLHQLLGQIADCMWVVDPETKQATNKIRDESRYHILSCLRYLATICCINQTFETAEASMYIAGEQIV